MRCDFREALLILAVFALPLVGGVCNRIRGGYMPLPPVLGDGLLTHVRACVRVTPTLLC